MYNQSLIERPKEAQALVQMSPGSVESNKEILGVDQSLVGESYQAEQSELL